MPKIKLLHCYIAKLLKPKNLFNNSTIQQFNNAFTLIEFLVVLGILVITVGSTLLFLTSVLRGSNKTNVTTEVKQNGQTVLNQLEKQIRNAIDAEESTDLPLGASKHLILTRQGDTRLHIACFPSTATNGWIGTGKDPGTNLSDYTSLTNKEDAVSGVDIDCSPAADLNCSLKVTPPSTGLSSSPIVSVCFVANQGIDAPSRQDFQANVKFQTTISLRKY